MQQILTPTAKRDLIFIFNSVARLCETWLAKPNVVYSEIGHFLTSVRAEPSRLPELSNYGRMG